MKSFLYHFLCCDFEITILAFLFLEKAKIENEKEGKEGENKKEDADVKGIPSFWLTIFKNVDMLSEMVQVSS